MYVHNCFLNVTEFLHVPHQYTYPFLILSYRQSDQCDVISNIKMKYLLHVIAVTAMFVMWKYVFIITGRALKTLHFHLQTNMLRIIITTTTTIIIVKLLFIYLLTYSYLHYHRIKTTSLLFSETYSQNFIFNKCVVNYMYMM